MAETIGFRIRKTRKAAGLSQSDVERLGGPSRTALSRIERGDVTDPEQFTIESLAHVLKVSPEWILNGEIPSVAESKIDYKTTNYSIDTALLAACITCTDDIYRHFNIKTDDLKRAKVVAALYDWSVQRFINIQSDPKEKVVQFVKHLIA